MELSSKSFYIASSTKLSSEDKAIEDTGRIQPVDSDSRTVTHLADLYRDLNADFLTILSLIVEYDIESVDLTRLGIPNTDSELHSRLAYSLGAGHSCNVVRHVTNSDAGPKAPVGTVVALKKYIPNPSTAGQDERSRLVQSYNTIRKEIMVHCDPILRKHCNICELLYVGWEEDSSLPILAVELAAYGSLEDVLTMTGTGPTILQKCNLTIDIALGISALHRCNIGHGDIKPANILVQRNPERQIIAKITDFGGVTDLLNHDSAPTLGTPLWSPPEVLFGNSIIDWKKADGYSYGLVIASIWSRPNKYLTQPYSSSCFLDRYLSTQGSSEERLDWLLLTKAKVDNDSASVIARGLAMIEGDSKNEIQPILRSTLSVLPTQRKEMSSLIDKEIADLAELIDRSISSEIQVDRPEVDNTSPVSRSRANRLFKVWSPRYLSRSEKFQAFVLRQMLVEIEGLDGLLEILPNDMPSDLFGKDDVNDFLEIAMAGVKSVFRHAWHEALVSMQHYSRLACHVGLSYFLGLGTKIDEQLGMRWMYVAALGGFEIAVSMAPLLHRSCPDVGPFQGPWRVFAFASSLLGCRSSLNLLREQDENIYRAALKTIQTKPCLRILDVNDDHGPYLINVLSAYRESDDVDLLSLDLKTAIRMKNASLARCLLASGGEAINEDGHEPGIMHYLSKMEDEDAASLAPLCFQNGGRLDISAMESDPPTIGSSSGNGTPLIWAIQANMTALAQALFNLHVDHEIEIREGMLTLIAAAFSHGSQILDDLLQENRRRPGLFQFDEDDDTGHPLIQTLLWASMDEKDLRMIHRRIALGPKYRSAKQDTISLLLKEGADPTTAIGPNGWNAFCIAIRQNDDISLRLFVDHLISSHTHPLLFMMYPEPIAGDHNKHNALQRCIYKKSRECFQIILDAFPELIEHKNARELTALHSAPASEDCWFVESLLQRGAGIIVHSRDRSTPLFRALTWENFESANLLASKCTEEELKALFGPDQYSGSTLLNKFLSAWLSDRSYGKLKAVKWIFAKGGGHFIGHEPTGNPAWNVLLASLPPPLRSHAMMDAALLKILFDFFPDKLERHDRDGRAPLHRAVWNGNLEVIKALLQRGVDVNLETTLATFNHDPSRYNPQNYVGKSALDIAILRTKASALPEIVVAGGAIEIQKWTRNMQEIIKVLISYGARSGSGADLSQALEAMKFVDPVARSNIVVQSRNEPLSDDELWKGNWPENLPRDGTSLSEAQIEEERNNISIQRADGTIVRVNRRAALALQLHD